MLETELNNINSDIKILLNDARVLFNSAASLSGDKAQEVRERGQRLLDAALLKTQEYQAQAVDAGKQIATCTDEYVKKNPWRTVAIGAGVGLLIGVLLGRK
jgi:ElaB/YqjD/DUF883 family membrane-anchored ribosome-binding protein